MTQLTNKQLAEIDARDFWGEDVWKQWKQGYDKCMSFRKTIKGKPTPEQQIYIEANAQEIEYYEFRLYHSSRQQPCPCSWCAKKKLLPKVEVKVEAKLEQEPSLITKLPLDDKNRMLRIGFGKHEGKWFVRIDLWKVGFRFSKP